MSFSGTLNLDVGTLHWKSAKNSHTIVVGWLVCLEVADGLHP